MLQVNGNKNLLLGLFVLLCYACKGTGQAKPDEMADGGVQLPKHMWTGHILTPNGDKAISIGFELNIASGKVIGREYMSPSPGEPLVPLRYILGTISDQNVLLKFSNRNDNFEEGISGTTGYFEGTLIDKSLGGNCITPRLQFKISDGGSHTIEGITARCKLTQN